MKRNYLLIFLFIVKISFCQTWLQSHPQISLPNKPSKSTLGAMISVNGGNQIGQSTLPSPGIIKTYRDFYHMEIDFDYSFFPSEGILNPNTCNCTNVWCNTGNCNTYINNPGGPSSFNSKKGFYCAWKGTGYQFTEIYASLESIFPKKSFGGCYNGYDIDRHYPNKWYSLSEWGGLGSNRAEFFKLFIAFFNHLLSY